MYTTVYYTVFQCTVHIHRHICHVKDIENAAYSNSESKNTVCNKKQGKSVAGGVSG